MKRTHGQSANRHMAKSMKASDTTLRPTMGDALTAAAKIGRSLANATTRPGDPLRPKPPRAA